MTVPFQKRDAAYRRIREPLSVHTAAQDTNGTTLDLSLLVFVTLNIAVFCMCGCDRTNDVVPSTVARRAAQEKYGNKVNARKTHETAIEATIFEQAIAAKEDLDRQLVRLEKRTENEDASAQDFYQLGETLFRLRQHAAPQQKMIYDADAVEAFKRAHALSGDKGFARALVGAARVYLRVNNLIDGMRYLEEAGTLNPEDIWVRAALARRLAFQSGDWTESIKTMEQLVAEPDGRESPVLWHWLGYAYQEAGRLRDADRAFRKRIELDPTQVGAWINLGTVLTAQGNGQEARRAYALVLKVDKTNGYATNNLALALVNTGDPKEARRAIKMVKAMLEVEPGFVAAWGNLGHAYLIVGECENAIDAYQTAARAMPKHAEGWNNLGLAHFECRDYKSSIDALVQAQGIDPVNTRTLYNLGNAYAQARRFAESASMLRRAGELNPKDSRIWNNLGTVLMNLAQYKDAAEAYKTALKHNPSSDNALQNVVLAFVANEDAAGAVAVMDNLLATTPPRPKIYCERATALLHMRKLARAIEDCNRALQLDARCSQAHWIRGVLHLADGRFVDARGDFERASRDHGYAAFAVVYAWIARARSTARDEPVASSSWASGMNFRDAWESAMVAFVNGEIDAEALLESARDDGQRCEAYFYIAEQVRHEFGIKAARPWYERCIETRKTGFFEFRLATWALSG